MSANLMIRIGPPLFALLYAVAMFWPTLPEGAYPDERVLSLLAEPGPRAAIVVGGLALIGAGLVFLCWSSALVSRLDPGADWLARAGQGAGVGYSLLLMLAALSFAGLALGVAVGELPVPQDPFLVRALSDQGFGLLLLPGLLCAAVHVVAVSALARRLGALPGWVTVTGWVIAPLLVLGFTWAPQFLVPLWTLLVAVTWRGVPGRDGQPAPAASRVSAAV